MSADFIEDCIAERHNYARHTFTSTITWFTFFVAINYGTMGWLTGATSKAPANYRMIALVACGFFLQNILGIIACFIVRAYFFRCNGRTLEAQAVILREKTIAEDPTDLAGQTCLPIRLYSTVIILMIIALVPILLAWAVLPFIYPKA
jgi:hypothetical protein